MKTKTLCFQWLVVLLKLLKLSAPKEKESVSERVDRERDVFLANLPDEKVILAISANNCLAKDYCTHFFALGHDAYRDGHKDIFLCWELNHCLCTIKQKSGCGQCWCKNNRYSLCWGYFEQEKAIQLKLPIAVA